MYVVVYMGDDGDFVIAANPYLVLLDYGGGYCVIHYVAFTVSSHVWVHSRYPLIGRKKAPLSKGRN